MERTECTLTQLPYDAVIFDLDGTLTESEPGIIKSVQYSLDQLGVTDFDPGKLQAFIGPPLFQSYVETMGMDEETARRGVALYRERFSKLGWQENAVYPGIPRLLRSLKRRGAYIALATSKPDLFTGRIVRHFGLDKYVDRVVAASPDSEHSDKPALVKAALPKSYRRACMVGDRKFDVEGALANGIDAVGVLYGYGDEPELLAAGAHHICATVQDLQAHLLGGLAPEKGLFISLEGPDGCGKSTQAPALRDWLVRMGHEVVLTREPGGSPVAERIRGVVLDPAGKGMTDLTEALLFAAARAQHVHDTIRPALQAGKTVLCDRYVDSSIAYQGVGRGLGIELVKALNAPGVQGCMPDVTVVFDLDPEVGLKRRTRADAPDRIEQTALDFIHSTTEYYRNLAATEPRAHRFDASGAPDEVAEHLRTFITKLA